MKLIMLVGGFKHARNRVFRMGCCDKKNQNRSFVFCKQCFNFFTTVLKLNIEAHNFWNTEYFSFFFNFKKYVRELKSPKTSFSFSSRHSGGRYRYQNIKNKKCSFLPKNGFGSFCLVTIMVPTSLQGAGMKRKSRFSGFSANVDVV